MLKNKELIAYIELILSMVFLGSTLVMGKILVNIFPVFILLSIRFLIGTGIFAVIYFFIKDNRKNASNIKLLEKHE